MNTRDKYRLLHVAGDTYYIDAGGCSIPLFKTDRNHAILFDSGLSQHGDGLLALLDKNGISIRAILTSHAHIDHTGNHALLREKFGSRVYMTLFNAAVSENPLALKAYFYGSSYKEMIAITSSMQCHTDQLMRADQRMVEIDGVPFRILDLPGHSPEHVGFVTPDGVAYLADLFMGPKSLGKTRMPYSMCCQFDFASKEKALAYDYDFYVLAHEGVHTDIKAVFQMNRQMWEDTICQVEQIGDRPLSMEMVVKKALSIFNVKPTSIFSAVVFERSIRAILQYLVDQDRYGYDFESGVQMYSRKG